MAKRFRLRLSRIIPSFRPTSRSKTNPVQANPVPSFFRHSRINPTHAKLNFPSTTTTTTITPPPPNNQRRSFLNRHVSSAFCCLRSNPTLSDAEAPDFQWKKEDEFHVIAKVYDEMPRRKIYTSSNSGRSDVEDDVLPPAPPPSAAKKKRRGKKKTRGKIRISTSSAESGIFSDDGEETETLMSSSRSFSTESSPEKNLELETICEAAPIDNLRRRRKSSKKAKRARKSATKKLSWSSSGTPEIESPARLSVFQRMIPCSVDGKVRESYAVVKKSEDPYEDFKRSMMEMILEKQMFDDDDLEQLLHCFLSLNSRQYHGVIVQAFSEIWETLFCTRSVSGRRDSCFL
ncbi:hypothetical protein UlMin_039495 [Ulmus minor]